MVVKRNLKSLHHLEEVDAMGDVGRATPHIYTTLEDQQESYQEEIVRMKGKISMHPLSIMIDPESTHSYVTLKFVEGYGINKKRHDKPWLVQLATGTK